MRHPASRTIIAEVAWKLAAGNRERTGETMNIKTLTIAVGALLMAPAAHAQQQVATVTSSAAFTLRGAYLSQRQGVPS